MKTPKQWLEEFRNHPNEQDWLVIIKRIQDEAADEADGGMEWLSEALNSGDGTYKP